MKNKALAIISVLLLTSVINYLFIISKGDIRTVEFLSILAIGMLIGILFSEIFRKAFKKKA